MQRILQLSTLFIVALFLQPAHAQFGLPGRQSFSQTNSHASHEISGAPGFRGLRKYPSVNGSRITDPIGRLLLARVLNLKAEFRRVAFNRRRSSLGDGNHTAAQEAATLALTFPLAADPERLQEYSRIISEQHHEGTYEAFAALIRKKADLILVVGKPAQQHVEAAQGENVFFDARPIALSALVFLSNTKNNITGLSIERIRDVYTTKISNWKTLGGKDSEIFALTRDDDDSADFSLMELVMRDQETLIKDYRRAPTTGIAFDMAEDNENSLVYALNYERILDPRNKLKPLAINRVHPTSKTIADRTYPLTEPVYVVTRKGIEPDSPTATLRDWLLSRDGQKLIAQSGHVPIGKIK